MASTIRRRLAHAGALGESRATPSFAITNVHPLAPPTHTHTRVRNHALPPVGRLPLHASPRRQLFSQAHLVAPLLQADAALFPRLLRQLVHEDAYDPEMLHAAAAVCHTPAQWQQLYDTYARLRDVLNLGDVHVQSLLSACARCGTLPQAMDIVHQACTQSMHAQALARMCASVLVRMCETERELTCVDQFLAAWRGLRPDERRSAQAVQAVGDVTNPHALGGSAPTDLLDLCLRHGHPYLHNAALNVWVTADKTVARPGGPLAQWCGAAIVRPLLQMHAGATPRAGGTEHTEDSTGKSGWLSRFLPARSTAGANDIRGATSLCFVAADGTLVTRRHVICTLAAAARIFCTDAGAGECNSSVFIASCIEASGPSVPETLQPCVRAISLELECELLSAGSDQTHDAITELLSRMHNATSPAWDSVIRATVQAPARSAMHALQPMLRALASASTPPSSSHAAAVALCAAARAHEMDRKQFVSILQTLRHLVRLRAGSVCRAEHDATVFFGMLAWSRQGESMARLEILDELAALLRECRQPPVRAPDDRRLSVVNGTWEGTEAAPAKPGRQKRPARSGQKLVQGVGGTTSVYGDSALDIATDVSASRLWVLPPVYDEEPIANMKAFFDSVEIFDEAVLQGSRDAEVLYEARTRLRMFGGTKIGPDTLQWPAPGVDSASVVMADPPTLNMLRHALAHATTAVEDQPQVPSLFTAYLRPTHSVASLAESVMRSCTATDYDTIVREGTRAFALSASCGGLTVEEQTIVAFLLQLLSRSLLALPPPAANDADSEAWNRLREVVNSATSASPWLGSAAVDAVSLRAALAGNCEAVLHEWHKFAALHDACALPADMLRQVATLLGSAALDTLEPFSNASGGAEPRVPTMSALQAAWDAFSLLPELSDSARKNASKTNLSPMATLFSALLSSSYTQHAAWLYSNSCKAAEPLPDLLVRSLLFCLANRGLPIDVVAVLAGEDALGRPGIASDNERDALLALALAACSTQLHDVMDIIEDHIRTGVLRQLREGSSESLGVPLSAAERGHRLMAPTAGVRASWPPTACLQALQVDSVRYPWAAEMLRSISSHREVSVAEVPLPAPVVRPGMQLSAAKEILRPIPLLSERAALPSRERADWTLTSWALTNFTDSVLTPEQRAALSAPDDSQLYTEALVTLRGRVSAIADIVGRAFDGYSQNLLASIHKGDNAALLHVAQVGAVSRDAELALMSLGKALSRGSGALPHEHIESSLLACADGVTEEIVGGRKSASRWLWRQASSEAVAGQPLRADPSVHKTLRALEHVLHPTASVEPRADARDTVSIRPAPALTGIHNAATLQGHLPALLTEIQSSGDRWRSHKLVHATKLLLRTSLGHGYLPSKTAITKLLACYTRANEPTAVQAMLHHLRCTGALPM